MKMHANRASKMFLLLISATLAAQEPAASAHGMGDLKSLSHGFYYQSAQEWKRLDVTKSSGFSTKHGAGAFVGVLPSGVRLYDGPKAANQFESHKPVFGIRIDPTRPDTSGFNVRDLLIVRMARKKDHRELQVIEGGFESTRTGVASKDRIEVTLTKVGDEAFILTPKDDLEPGEYVATFRGANGVAGYDFGIK